jgi:PAS domain S-box-containing protein
MKSILEEENMKKDVETNLNNFQKTEKTHKIIINILKSATTSQNLEELFSSIRQLLSEIITVRNFSVSLYDPTKNLLNFIYHVDEKIVFDSFPAERTLTYFVIKTGQSLFADDKKQLELYNNKDIGRADPGTEADIWLGVPLKKDDETIGVVSVQSYDNADAYCMDDLKILELVADTIALAIIRKQNDVILKASEEKFRTLYDNTALGLYRTTPEGEILMVNQAIVDMLGYDSKEELMSKNLDSGHYTPEYSRDTFKKTMEENGALKGKESIWIMNNGQKRYIRESARAFRDEDGKIKYYDGVIEDVSEIRRKDLIKDVLLKISHSAATISNVNLLIQSIRKHLGELIETTNFGLAIYNGIEGSYTFPYYIDQNEEVPENHLEFIPNSLTEYCRKQGKAILVNSCNMVDLKKDHQVTLIGPDSKVWLGVPLITAKGTIGVLSLQSYENLHAYSEDDIKLLDSVAYTIAVVIEKKQAETALKSSEQRLSLALESAGLGLWDQDCTTGKIYRNEIWARILGYEPNEIEANLNLFENLIHPEDKELFHKMAELSESGQIPRFKIEHRMKAKDGSWKWIYNWGKVVERDKDGNPLRIIGTHLDITDSKETEIALRKSEEQFRILADQNPSLIFIFQNNRIKYVNKKSIEIMGYTYEEFYSESFDFLSTLSPSDHDKVIDNIRLLYAGKELQPHEVTLLNMAGEEIKVILSSKIIEFQDSPAILGIMTDITESIKTEKALKESEQRLSLALESTHLGLWDLDNRSGKIYRNDIWAEMLGYSLDEVEMTLDFFNNLVHPDDFEELRYQSKLGESGVAENFDVEHRLRTKDGNWKWIRNWGKVVEWDDEQKPTRVIGTHLDIDEEKRIRLALKESEEKYRGLFENSTDIVFTLDFDGNITDINKALEHNTQYKKKELLGTNFSVLFSKENGEKLVKKMNLMSETGKPIQDFLLDINRRNGEKLFWECSLILMEKNEKPCGFQGILRDVTKREEAEQNLLKHQDHIKLINSILRHDIANCFAVINSALNLYRRSKDATMLEEAVLQIKKGINLIRKMKKLENYFISNSELKSVDLANKLKVISSQYPNMKIVVNGNAKILADEALDSAFDNLFSNATKHGKATSIIIDITQHIDKCIISFADNGIGISDSIKSKIFDKAFKSGLSGNTGLGLYIVKKTIDRYNGNIEIEDNKPNGAKFIIELKCN